MDKKTCSKCGVLKPLNQFCKSKQVKSGYTAHCKECRKIYSKASNERVRAKDPEAYLARRRQYVKAYQNNHPERVAEKDWSYRIKTRFGMTPEQYYKMLERQGGLCAGCGTIPNGKKLAVDHDRSCCPQNKSCGDCVRGLLCSNCNTALGLLKDDKEVMIRLIGYLDGR